MYVCTAHSKILISKETHFAILFSHLDLKLNLEHTAFLFAAVWHGMDIEHSNMPF